jgi:hypothetical protein
MEYSAKQIAESLKVPRRTIQDDVNAIEQGHRNWYRLHKSREKRVEAYYKGIEDRLHRNIQERWTLFYNTPANDTLKRNAILDGMLKAYHELREHIGVIAPSLDQVYLEEKVRSMEALAFKIRQQRKVKPLA